MSDQSYNPYFSRSLLNALYDDISLPLTSTSLLGSHLLTSPMQGLRPSTAIDQCGHSPRQLWTLTVLSTKTFPFRRPSAFDVVRDVLVDDADLAMKLEFKPHVTPRLIEQRKPKCGRCPRNWRLSDGSGGSLANITSAPDIFYLYPQLNPPFHNSNGEHDLSVAQSLCFLGALGAARSNFSDRQYPKQKTLPPSNGG